MTPQPPSDEYLLNLLIHRGIWNEQEKMADLKSAAQLLHQHDTLLRRCYDSLPNPERETDINKREELKELLQSLANSIAWGVRCRHRLIYSLCPDCQSERPKS